MQNINIKKYFGRKSKDAQDILKQNNIIKLGNLCDYSKTDLKKINIQTSNINKIEIELQLLGLNLKGGI